MTVIHKIVSGAFAPASLMISKVVAKGKCENTEEMFTFTNLTELPTNITQKPLDDAVLSCKVAIATGITLVAGIYQVTKNF